MPGNASMVLDFVSPSPANIRSLWSDSRRGRRTLGFKASRAERGFAFWPRGAVDWRRLAFADDFADEFRLPEFKVLKGRAAAARLLEDSSTIEKMLALAAEFAGSAPARAVVCDFLANYLTRDYRRVACEKAFGPGCRCRPERGDLDARVREDRVDFSDDGLVEVYGLDPTGGRRFRLATGNRLRWRSPAQFFD